MRRFMRYQWGGTEVMQLESAPIPTPDLDELLIRVTAVSLNPIDLKVLAGGAAAERQHVTLPHGVGCDAAGVVEEIGPKLVGWAKQHGITVGTHVVGSTPHTALAEFVVVKPADALWVPVPDGLSDATAAASVIVGRTAWIALDQLGVGDGDVLFLSAANGGVGSIATQLAVQRGVRVVGTGSASGLDRIRGLGATAVEYGDGLVERLREAAPDGYTHALDCSGRESIEAALELGIPVEHIVSIVARGDDLLGAENIPGDQNLWSKLPDLLRLIADGDVRIDVECVDGLAAAPAALDRLATRTVRGKLVVIP